MSRRLGTNCAANGADCRCAVIAGLKYLEQVAILTIGRNASCTASQLSEMAERKRTSLAAPSEQLLHLQRRRLRHHGSWRA